VKNKKVFVIPVIFALIILNWNGYLSFEEKGKCSIQSPMFAFSEGEMIKGGHTVSTSIISESQCMEYCKIDNSNQDMTSCQFDGNFGTDWEKTSDDLPVRNVFGVK